MGPRPSEFEIIDRYFSWALPSKWHTQGIGDDCALVDIGATRVAVTTDTTAIGTHYLPDADPLTVGYKALAVNLSDLAAAGAAPRAFFLALSLPSSNAEWLDAFSRGLHEAATQFSCPLLGGDTTKTVMVNGEAAAATITITAIGEVCRGLTRGGAQAGDDVWVSGTPGDAYAALMLRTGAWQGLCDSYLASRMDKPTPRVALGQFLEPIASAAADISDGLIQDLGHILSRSGLGAEINAGAIAVSESLAKFPQEKRLRAQLAGGDDYELIFTAPKSVRNDIEAFARQAGLVLSRIGQIKKEMGLTLTDADGRIIHETWSGFDHFKSDN